MCSCISFNGKQYLLIDHARFKSVNLVADRFALELMKSKSLNSISSDGATLVIKINLDSSICSNCLITTCMLYSKLAPDDPMPSYITDTILNQKHVVKFFYNSSKINYKAVEMLLKKKHLYISTAADQRFKFSLMFKEYPVWSACILRKGKVNKIINSVFLDMQEVERQLCQNGT